MDSEAMDPIRAVQQRLLDHLFAFVGVLTPDGTLVEANRTALDRGGLTRADVIDRPFWDCWWWSHDPSVQTRLRTAVAEAATGATVRYDERVRMAEGVAITIDFMLSPFRDASGRVTHLIPSAVDVSERVALAAALGESEGLSRARLAELESIYRTAPIGLCILDRDLRFLRINERLAEINGRSAADHIGRSLREMAPDLADQASVLLARVLETGDPLADVELVGETPAAPGRRRTWLENWAPVRDETGAVIAVNVSAQEITERKHLEERLRESEAAARELAETRMLLIREINHRVKNSLSLVAALLDLQRSRATGEAAAALEEAGRRVMTVAQVHRGFYATDEPGRLDLEPMLAEVTGQLATMRPAVAVVLEMAEPVRLPADQGVPLGLIVNELCTNALKHAFPNGATGRVVVRVAREAGRAVVSVTDDGSGLPPGWTLETGRGLGGRLLRGLSAQLGAEMSAEVPAAGGTRFRIVMPEDAPAG